MTATRTVHDIQNARTDRNLSRLEAAPARFVTAEINFRDAQVEREAAEHELVEWAIRGEHWELFSINRRRCLRLFSD